MGNTIPYNGRFRYLFAGIIAGAEWFLPLRLAEASFRMLVLSGYKRWEMIHDSALFVLSLPFETEQSPNKTKSKDSPTMASRIYSTLVRREKNLRMRFINRGILKEPLSDRSQDMLRAFRVLMHAEIEYYIEQITLNKIERAKAVWLSRKKLSIALVSVLSYCRMKFPQLQTVLNEVNSKNDLNYRINKALDDYISKVKRNNGIKETDIVPLFVQLGVDYNQISQTLLNSLSSYGKLRGDVAHNSYKVTQPIDPMNEINTVRQLLIDLESLDELIIKT